jgi:O-antigen ligase
MSVDEVSAVESTRARKILLQDSLYLMLEHPVFGVGPGIFSAALATEQEKQGAVQTWHEAHNSFTQMGSEAGLPGIIIYLVLVIYSLQRSISIYRRTKKDPNRIMISRMAGTLAMSLIIYVICAAFGNYAYTFHLPVLAGLVQALDVCVRKEMTIAPAVVPAPPPMHSGIPTLQRQVPNYVRNRRLRDRRV